MVGNLLAINSTECPKVYVLLSGKVSEGSKQFSLPPEHPFCFSSWNKIIPYCSNYLTGGCPPPPHSFSRVDQDPSLFLFNSTPTSFSQEALAGCEKDIPFSFLLPLLQHLHKTESVGYWWWQSRWQPSIPFRSTHCQRRAVLAQGSGTTMLVFLKV